MSSLDAMNIQKETPTNHRTPTSTHKHSSAKSQQEVTQKLAKAGGLHGHSPSSDDIAKMHKRSDSTAKSNLIALGAALGALVIVYLAGLIFFTGHFYPHTQVFQEDLSYLSQDKAITKLEQFTKNYKLHVVGDGVDFTISSQELDLALDAQFITTEILQDNEAWKWPIKFFSQRDAIHEFSDDSNQFNLDALIRPRLEEFNATAQPSKDASMVYDKGQGLFVIQPEIYGTSLDIDKVIEKATQAVADFRTTLELTQSELAEPAIVRSNEQLQAACAKANEILSAKIELLVHGQVARTLGANDIIEMLELDQDFNPHFNEEALKNFCNTMVAEFNTRGSERRYTRPDGKEVTVSGGVYGWVVKSDALTEAINAAVASGTSQQIEVPFAQNAAVYQGKGYADWGPRFVDVDLSEQYARFYDGGSVIWEAPIVSGRPEGGHQTPAGVYVVNLKESPSTLVGEIDPETNEPEYKTEVAFWMPFIGNSIGFHDAVWQPAFGGNLYQEGRGSHGCINLPYDAAASLYGLLAKSDVVVVHY